MPKVAAIKKAKKAPEFIRRKIKYDSIYELYFSMWLDELQKAGYIKKWSKIIYSYIITKPLIHEYDIEVKLKTKTKIVTKKQTLLNGSVYTPDFSIEWAHKADKIFFQILRCPEKITTYFLAYQKTTNAPVTSVVEIKPGFDFQNMTRVWTNNQKFMWSVHHIFVNTINVEQLFENTFTPTEFLKTNKTHKVRKINWLTQTLKQFIDGTH